MHLDFGPIFGSMIKLMLIENRPGNRKRDFLVRMLLNASFQDSICEWQCMTDVMISNKYFFFSSSCSSSSTNLWSMIEVCS